jgi:hypothetical protein
MHRIRFGFAAHRAIQAERQRARAREREREREGERDGEREGERERERERERDPTGLDLAADRAALTLMLA